MEFQVGEVRLVLPEYREDAISEGLRFLTKCLGGGSGGLGGEYGYGVDFENSVFMMHPFCWCDKEDCNWCSGFGGPKEAVSWKEKESAPNFWHKSSGLKIWWYKWIGRGVEVVSPEGDLIEWDRILRECVESVR